VRTATDMTTTTHHSKHLADQIYELCPAIERDLEKDLMTPKRPKGWECRNRCQVVLDLGDVGGCLCFCSEHRDECPSHGNPATPGFWRIAKEKLMAQADERVL